MIQIEVKPDLEVQENERFIPLNAFLKLKGIAKTGGDAKNIIRSEQVNVNDVVETRNKKKLYPRDKVQVGDSTLIVDAKDIR